MNSNNWIAITDRKPPKDTRLMIADGNKPGPTQRISVARLRDGWLDAYEAEIEEQRGEGEGKRLDGVWVEEMDDRFRVDFVPTHWSPMDPLPPEGA